MKLAAFLPCFDFNLRSYSMAHLQLRGEDDVPDRSHIVYLCGVQSGTSTGAVAQRFTAAGLGMPLQIYWVGRCKSTLV